MAEDNIFKFEDDPVYPDLFHEYPASLSESKVPLVIDNGIIAHNIAMLACMWWIFKD